SHRVLPAVLRCQRRSLCPPAYQTSPALSLSKACPPQNSNDLGKYRECLTAKPWHVHGYTSPLKGGFYPKLGKVGKALLAFFMRRPSGCQPRVKACQQSRQGRYTGRRLLGRATQHGHGPRTPAACR